MARRTFNIQAQPGFSFIALFTFFTLYLPIAALVVYAFNDSESLSTWGGFSTRWFVSASNNSVVQDAAGHILSVGTNRWYEVWNTAPNTERWNTAPRAPPFPRTGVEEEETHSPRPLPGHATPSAFSPLANRCTVFLV